LRKISPEVFKDRIKLLGRGGIFYTLSLHDGSLRVFSFYSMYLAAAKNSTKIGYRRGEAE
jgi:hypothetical protein